MLSLLAAVSKALDILFVWIIPVEFRVYISAFSLRYYNSYSRGNYFLTVN